MIYMRLNNNIKYWVPVFLYAGLIFYVSSIPGSDVPSIGIDLSPIHIPEFYILSYLLFRALRRNGTNKPLTSAILAIGISTIYGMLDEIHQLFVPGRIFSVYDIFLNLIGSLIILFNLYGRTRFLKNKLNF